MLNHFQRDMTTLADSMYVWLTTNHKCFTSVLETVQKRLGQNDVCNIFFQVAYYFKFKIPRRKAQLARVDVLQLIYYQPMHTPSEIAKQTRLWMHRFVREEAASAGEAVTLRRGSTIRQSPIRR